MRKILAPVSILSFTVAGALWSADVTVSKPGGGGAYTTVQAGINAAGPNGSVTILDNGTYAEDVTIAMGQAGVTVKAGTGVRPTIQAANAVNRPVYQAIGIVSPSDRFGISVQAPCTLIGLNICNLDGTCNQHGVYGGLAASALIIHSPLVTVNNCRIYGPGTGFGSGDWVSCLVVAFSETPASARLENCEVYGGEYGVVDETFYVAMPTWADSSVFLAGCDLHDNTAAGLQVDAGFTSATSCRIRNNATGIGFGGGSGVLTGCDIMNNRDEGIDIDWNSSFAHKGDYGRVTARDCFFLANGSGERNIHVRDGSLTIERSIISLGNRGGIYLHTDDPGDAYLNMDFCDVFAPGQTCVQFDGPGAYRAFASIRNSILFGTSGILGNAAPDRAGASYSSISITTGTATVNTATSNTVTIAAQYLNAFGNTRYDFRYLNANLNVGESGAEIGSQGRATGGANARRWGRYD